MIRRGGRGPITSPVHELHLRSEAVALVGLLRSPAKLAGSLDHGAWLVDLPEGYVRPNVLRRLVDAGLVCRRGADEVELTEEGRERALAAESQLRLAGKLPRRLR